MSRDAMLCCRRGSVSRSCSAGAKLIRHVRTICDPKQLGGVTNLGQVAFTQENFGTLRIEDGVGFNFDQHFGRDQAADLNHAGGGTNVAKEFAMSAADFLPFGDVE